MFQSSHPSIQTLEASTGTVDKKVTTTMNSDLTVEFTREEIEKALKQMVTPKFSSLDDFNPRFYQTYWHIVRDEVTSVILNFLNDGCFDNSINFTYIDLIPKVKNPLTVSNFRPIRLCNVIYN